MSVTLCPVIRGSEVSVYSQNGYLLHAFTVNTVHGIPNVYVSGNSVVIQHGNGGREVYRYDNDGHLADIIIT